MSGIRKLTGATYPKAHKITRRIRTAITITEIIVAF
jgi:hypothetical protein